MKRFDASFIRPREPYVTECEEYSNTEITAEHCKNTFLEEHSVDTR